MVHPALLVARQLASGTVREVAVTKSRSRKIRRVAEERLPEELDEPGDVPGFGPGEAGSTILDFFF